MINTDEAVKMGCVDGLARYHTEKIDAVIDDESIQQSRKSNCLLFSNSLLLF